jgi:hypothetical protein
MGKELQELRGRKLVAELSKKPPPPETRGKTPSGRVIFFYEFWKQIAKQAHYLYYQKDMDGGTAADAINQHYKVKPPAKLVTGNALIAMFNDFRLPFRPYHRFVTNPSPSRPTSSSGGGVDPRRATRNFNDELATRSGIYGGNVPYGPTGNPYGPAGG